MLAVDIFGLGQATPTAVPANGSRTVTLPAIPDDTAVRCKFDREIGGYRCSPIGLFETPTVFLLAAGGLALLAVGYTFGQTRFLQRFVEAFARTPRAVR